MRPRFQKKFVFSVFLLTASCQAKNVDYNNMPLVGSGTQITLTPQTPPSTIANYTQAFNTAGLLDQTFGSGGIVAGVIVGASPVINAMALQPDNKIVVAGTTNSAGGGNFFLTRYNPNGSLDASFNHGNFITGTATQPAGPAAAVNALVLQPNGKIITLGGTTLPGTAGSLFCLGRYNQDGSVDTNFNGGRPLVPTPGGNTTFAGLLQSDGKIVGVGNTEIGGGAFNFCLIRFNPDGTTDSTFNGGNLVQPANTSTAHAALLQPDGKIVAVGDAQDGFGGYKFCLIRFNTNGTPDANFNGGLPTLTPGTWSAFGAVLQTDGKIVAVGSSTAAGIGFCLVRYNTDGGIDQTFNGGVPVVTPGTTTFATSALLQPDGKIVVGGTNGTHFCLARYNTDGSLDTTFGPNGINFITTTGTKIAQASLVQPNMSIILGGQNATPQISLARYINPFTLASFNASYGAVGML